MSSYKMRTTKRWICPICGSQKDAKAKYCRDCRNQQRESELPDPVTIRRVLDLFGWNYCAAGRYFRVSDNAVRKWCRRFNIQKEHQKP